MNLREIYAQYGIELRDKNGELRNTIDVLEDMFLKLSVQEFLAIGLEITEEEKYADLFNNERGRSYKGVE